MLIQTMQYDKDLLDIDFRHLNYLMDIHSSIISHGCRSDIPSKHRWWEYGFALDLIKDEERREIEPKNCSRFLDILDIGAGYSPLGPALANVGHHVTEYDTAIDWATDRIEMAKRMQISPGYIVLDMVTEVLPQRYFDVITCISVLEHCDAFQRKEILYHATKYLKPGGLLFVTADIEHPDRASNWRHVWKEPYLNGVEFKKMFEPFVEAYISADSLVDTTYYEDLDADHDYTFIKAVFRKKENANGRQSKS